MRLDTALMSTPRSISEVANVRRPEWLDAWSRPAARYIRLNSICIVFGLKPPHFRDKNKADAGCNGPSVFHSAAVCAAHGFAILTSLGRIARPMMFFRFPVVPQRRMLHSV
jgi:hypothetical protein